MNISKAYLGKIVNNAESENTIVSDYKNCKAMEATHHANMMSKMAKMTGNKALHECAAEAHETAAHLHGKNGNAEEMESHMKMAANHKSKMK